MVLKLVKRLGIIAGLALVLSDPADLSSCGPFFPEAVFTRANAPDNAQAFFQGHLGILQPTYGRRYLAMAYRILSGEPLSNAQVAALSNLERDRNSDPQDAANEWVAARQQVPGSETVQVEVYRRGSNFVSFPGCGADAFDTARQTLLNLIRQAGADSAEVHDWLAAQDQVFADCSGGSAVPEPAPPESSARVRANRAYQIAAAYFYSNSFDRARTVFSQIAADEESPWHVLAPYLIARCDLRQDDYGNAEKQLLKILSDARESKIHTQTERLLDYARARLDPSAQLLAISKRLMERDSAELSHDLSDYTFLFDKMQNGRAYSPHFTQEQYQAALNESIKQLQAAAAKDDLTDWILQFQGVWVEKRPDYVELWRRSNSPAWLIQALYSTSGKMPQAGELIDAARDLPSDSPAYATARFEAARLLIEANRNADAAALLDDVLPRFRDAKPKDNSTWNAFRAERMRVAKDFRDFLTYAPRTMAFEAVVDEGYGSFGSPTSKLDAQPLAMFDTDATLVFNRSLPLARWLEAVKTRDLALRLRVELAQSGWVRAVLSNQYGRQFARELATLKPAYASGLEPYLAAHDDGAERFEAAFFILHHPEMQPVLRSGLQRSTRDGRIDDFRDNWWALQDQLLPVGGASVLYREGRYTAVSPILQQLYPGGKRPQADFLSVEDKNKAAKEQGRLKAAGGAPSFLSSIVASWAKSHPSDARNAEALALAVKTSHFSPSTSNASHSVREAFDLLHTRYPKTDWAQGTPYWYK